MNRKWQKARVQASHSEDWLITYADMITLLLCFFVVFLIMSMTKKESPQKQTTEHIVQTAPPVQNFKVQQVRPQEADAPEVTASRIPFRDIELSPFHKIEPDADKVQTPAPMPVEVAPVAVAPVEQGPETVAMPTAMPVVEPALLPAQAPAVMVPGGDRITTMEMSSAAFFDRGSAVLSEAGKVILVDLVLKLKGDAYKDYTITVEGHTDDTPVATTQFPSNWELSTARASAVVQYFITQGVSANKLRAAGYADTMPKAPNRDAANRPIPENEAMNRRVVIKLEKIEKAEVAQ